MLNFQEEAKFTNPTITQVDCISCCNESFFGDDEIGACNTGCLLIENCFQIGGFASACLDGSDFRLIGTASIDGNELSCIDGSTVGFSGFVTPENPVNSEAQCVECCIQANNDFNQLQLFDQDFCEERCSKFGNCFNEGNTENRLGCSIAFDFLTSGSVTVVTEISNLLTTVDLTCDAGVLVEVDPIEDPDVPDPDQDTDDEDPVVDILEDEDDNLLLTLIISISATLLLCVLIALFCWCKQRSNQDLELILLSPEELQKSKRRDGELSGLPVPAPTASLIPIVRLPAQSGFVSNIRWSSNTHSTVNTSNVTEILQPENPRQYYPPQQQQRSPHARF